MNADIPTCPHRIANRKGLRGHAVIRPFDVVCPAILNQQRSQFMPGPPAGLPQQHPSNFTGASPVDPQTIWLMSDCAYASKASKAATGISKSTTFANVDTELPFTVCAITGLVGNDTIRMMHN